MHLQSSLKFAYLTVQILKNQFLFLEKHIKNTQYKTQLSKMLVQCGNS